jgi:hypothetical protein
LDRKIDSKKIKNKKAVLTGTAFFFISAFYLSELFQYVVSINFTDVKLDLNFIFLSNTYEAFNSSNLVNSISLFADIFFIMLTVETAYYFLKKLPLGYLRFTIILFIVLSLGMIILNVFYGFISVLLNGANNDWIQFFNIVRASFQEKIIYSLGFILTIFLYLNLITRRIIKYIKT